MSDKPKTAAELLREIAAADPIAHRQALARGYGAGPTPSGVPAQGLDLDEIERRLVGTRREAIEVLPDVPALTAELRALGDLAAHLEAELARATGEVNRLRDLVQTQITEAANVQRDVDNLSEELATIRAVERQQWERANLNAAELNRVALECESAREALAAERMKVARVQKIIDDIETTCPLEDWARSQWWEAMDAVCSELRAALSGDTGTGIYAQLEKTAAAYEAIPDHLKPTVFRKVRPGDTETLDAPKPCDHCTSWSEVEPGVLVCRRAAAGMCPAAASPGDTGGTE